MGTTKTKNSKTMATQIPTIKHLGTFSILWGYKNYCHCLTEWMKDHSNEEIRMPFEYYYEEQIDWSDEEYEDNGDCDPPLLSGWSWPDYTPEKVQCMILMEVDGELVNCYFEEAQNLTKPNLWGSDFDTSCWPQPGRKNSQGQTWESLLKDVDWSQFMTDDMKLIIEKHVVETTKKTAEENRRREEENRRRQKEREQVERELAEQRRRREEAKMFSFGGSSCSSYRSRLPDDLFYEERQAAMDREDEWKADRFGSSSEYL